MEEDNKEELNSNNEIEKLDELTSEPVEEKHDFPGQRPPNGFKKVRKKIITLFGFKMPGVRISPLGPIKSTEFVRIRCFFLLLAYIYLHQSTLGQQKGQQIVCLDKH